MKSPMTGKPMKLMREKRDLTFRKETFPVMFHFYKCEESGQQFTTTELDELNLTQLYNQYRSKHNIPFPDEIRETREQYGVSAARMSEILGLGINVYRQYEQGEVPSHSNARLIQLAKDPDDFIKLVNKSDLKEAVKNKLIAKTEKLISSEKEEDASNAVVSWLTGPPLADEFTGFRHPDIKKLTDLVRYFTTKLQPWKTQMNKLLFYADFLHFKKTGYSITGFRYCAIDMGPVPDRFQGLFEYICEASNVKIIHHGFRNGIGEQFILLHPSDEPFNFTETELGILNRVIKEIGMLKTDEVIKLSHREKAWKENKDRKSKWISYQEYGFDVNEI